VTGKPNVAIVGSGVSGLTVAYLLRDVATVTVYERRSRIGGHVRTVACPLNGTIVYVDTGFIVLNRTYAGFLKLLEELGVETHSADASLSVRTMTDSLEMNLASLNGWFGQRRRLLSASHWALLLEAIALGRRVRKSLVRETDKATVREFLDKLGAGNRFRRLVVFPLITSIWNADIDVASEYAAATILKSLRDLYLAPSLDWQVVTGGADIYVRRLVQAAHCEVITGNDVRRVEQDEDQVRLFFADREPMAHDYAVLACPPGAVLDLIPAMERSNRVVLKRFGENQTRVTIHSDDLLVSSNPRCRGAWNFIVGPEHYTVTYDLRRLMQYQPEGSVFSTVNGEAIVRPECIMGNEEFSHVTFPVGTRMKRHTMRLGRVHICGAWTGNGNHEAGVQSACEVARQFGISWP
jgi:predicted NAD/FAD-binding protein